MTLHKDLKKTNILEWRLSSIQEEVGLRKRLKDRGNKCTVTKWESGAVRDKLGIWD